MKNIIWMMTTVSLIFVIGFCVSDIVSGQDNQDATAVASYYDSLESAYLKQVKEILKEQGYEYSGVNLTKTITDSKREYEMLICNQRFEQTPELTQKELMNQLEMILLDEGDSIIMISLVSP